MSNLFKYLKKYLGKFVLTIVLACISVVSTLFIPIIVGKIIDCLISYNVDFTTLFTLLTKMLITIVITFSSQYLLSLINNHIGFNCCKSIRLDGFKKLNSISISYVDKVQSGDITSRIINDVDSLSDGLILGLTNFFTSILTIILTIVYMLQINVKITIIVLILTPISLLLARFISSKTNKFFIAQSSLKGKLSGYIDEIVNNQNLVVSFNQQDNCQNNFDEINNQLKEAGKNATFFSSLTNPTTRLVNALIYAIIAVFGANEVLLKTISIGGLTTFLSYASQYSKPFNEISSIIVELQNAIACGNRIFQLIQEEDDKDCSNNDFDQEINSIEFKNVAFSYSPNKPLITDLSFKVNKGQKIAIVGPTGCGKTTLINLLMRFYDVNSGEILINGTNVKNVSKNKLRSYFGMVLQDSWLKQASIKENLQFGKKVDDETMIKAAKACYIDSFIQRLPNQYDTVIDENSDSISQGQKQLLSIARVMISDPQILILDEATSSIDTRTEIKVQQAFDKLMENKTAFIVAHRLSTIENADLILVMNNGNIIEKGNHQQLLSQKGFYYNLYNSQFQKAD